MQSLTKGKDVYDNPDYRRRKDKGFERGKTGVSGNGD